MRHDVVETKPLVQLALAGWKRIAQAAHPRHGRHGTDGGAQAEGGHVGIDVFRLFGRDCIGLVPDADVSRALPGRSIEGTPRRNVDVVLAAREALLRRASSLTPLLN